jgi:hypothetical protein
MIYNLVAYIRQQLPSTTVYTNERPEHAKDTCVLVRESGGNLKPWNGYANPTVQVLARAADAPKARVLAYQVLYALQDKYGLILPATVVDGVTYAALWAAQITAVQLPYSLGPDGEGRSVYTTNYQIIMVR